jgi:hypothetical protein
MGRIIPSLLVICLISFDLPGQVQSPVKVSEPRLELRDNLIHISYDILNSTPSDQFDVSLFVKDEDGNEIVASTLEGDIGQVTGGSNKHITWDPAADRIFIDSRIFIKVIAKVLTAPDGDSQEKSPAERNDQETGEIITENGSATAGKEFNTAGLVIQSTLFPGWGLTRVKKKPHWLKGLAGYGCIAGAIYMNKQALDTYSGIDQLIEFEDKNNLYERARREYWISNGLGFTALTIWVVDMIWTLGGILDQSENSWISGNLSLSLDVYSDPFTYAPMMGIRYDFKTGK